MILVDTSIWIDHLRQGDPHLVTLLNQGQVLTHAFVIGELAVGNLRVRNTVLEALLNLPVARTATDEEVRLFIDRNLLFGLGIGYIDAHLLASVRLTVGSLLWTRDKRLQSAAERLSLSVQPEH
jgi:predicted nucleic acid-binding protein